MASYAESSRVGGRYGSVWLTDAYLALVTDILLFQVPRSQRDRTDCAVGIILQIL